MQNCDKWEKPFQKPRFLQGFVSAVACSPFRMLPKNAHIVFFSSAC